jgi:hypothetical protein
MTIRTALAVFLLFALTSTGFGQSRDADLQTTREILAEIRGIHEDMRIAQSTQILLMEFEMQQSVVNRATENVDSARAKLLDIQRDQKPVRQFTEENKRTQKSLTIQALFSVGMYSDSRAWRASGDWTIQPNWVLALPRKTTLALPV